MSLFNWKKAKPELETKTMQNGIQMLVPQADRNIIDWSQPDLTNAYKKWVYTCCRYNANAIAAVNLKLVSFNGFDEDSKMCLWPGQEVSKKNFKYDSSLVNNLRYKIAGNMTELYAHPFLSLLDRPNDEDNRYTFMYKLATNLQLTGNGFILLRKEGEENGELGKSPITTGEKSTINSMHVLHSQFMVPKINYASPDNLNIIDGYWYTCNGKSRFYTLDQVIRFRYYNPMNDVYGFSPLQAIWGQHLLQMGFDEHQLAVLNNGANPSIAVTYKGVTAMTEKARDIMYAQWNKVFRGAKNTGKPFISGDDFLITKLGLTPQEMDFVDGRVETRNAIAGAYGVPTSFLDSKNANRASYQVDMIRHQEGTIRPSIQQMVDIINNKIVLPYFEEKRIMLTYDNPVASDRGDRIDEAIKLKNAGLMSVDEARMYIQE
jgi:HK97 family phage portal protein